MIFNLKKTFTFDAAHFLPNHEGKCKQLHGHTWKMIVFLEREHLDLEGPQAGMVMDFARVSEVVKPLISEYLDHKCLNETLELEHPTCEEVSRWVFERLELEFGMLLSAVAIEEASDNAVLYRRTNLRVSQK